MLEVKTKVSAVLLVALLAVNLWAEDGGIIRDSSAQTGSSKNWRMKIRMRAGFDVMRGSQRIYANDDTSDFLQMEQKIEDAVVSSDLEYLKNIYADDFRFAHGSGSIQNKSQWLESVAKRQFISRKISANEVELHGDVGITSARLDVTRRGKNGEEKYWLKYIRVYRRSGDIWKMISHRTTQETHL